MDHLYQSDNYAMIIVQTTDYRKSRCQKMVRKKLGHTSDNKPAHVVNGVVKLDNSRGELAQYYAATLLNPTKSTLLRAIQRNHLTTWTALTTKLIRKNLPK